MEFIDPSATLLQLGLRDGMRVGDFGCGSGHYAFAASAIVGPEGHVYAVDVQQDMLTRIKDDAERRHIKNVDFIWGNIEKAGNTKLKDASLNAVILSNTCFQLENKKDALAEVKRVLKHDGKVLLVEWSGAHEGVGPSKERIFTESAAEQFFIEQGFKKIKGFIAGPHHYAIVFAHA